MGAVYAADFLPASDAVKTAYLRGFHVKLEGGPTGDKGAMMASNLEGADELCNLPEFKGVRTT